MAAPPNKQGSKGDGISISFPLISEDSSASDLNHLDPTYMYTQLLKEILLVTEYNTEARGELVAYWKVQYAKEAHIKLVPSSIF